MKDKFEELLTAIQDGRKYCPWIKGQTLESYKNNIKEEAEEVILAIENNDDENLQEELGDVFWDLLMTICIAEQEGRIDSKKVIEGVIQKFKERKPHIFEKRTPPMEEVHKVWDEAKARQKERKNDN